MSEDIYKKFCSPGWIDGKGIYEWLRTHKFYELNRLHRDNRTDGEFHRQFVHSPSGKTFDLLANWYDAPSWKPLIDWVLSLNENSNTGMNKDVQIILKAIREEIDSLSLGESNPLYCDAIMDAVAVVDKFLSKKT